MSWWGCRSVSHVLGMEVCPIWLMFSLVLCFWVLVVVAIAKGGLTDLLLGLHAGPGRKFLTKCLYKEPTSFSLAGHTERF